MTKAEKLKQKLAEEKTTKPCDVLYVNNKEIEVYQLKDSFVFLMGDKVVECDGFYGISEQTKNNLIKELGC